MSAPSEATASTGRKRRAYWIADEITRKMRERALLLMGRGLEIRFFTSLEYLLKELESQRAGVIVISDDGDETKTERILTTLMTMPEIQGARLVMVRSGHSEWLNFLAAAGNVRDIIPANLDDKPWLARFLFATAARAVPFVQPAGQVTLNNISAINVPARLTWISPTRMRLESRLRPSVGATLTMGGPLADALGVASVHLRVLNVERQRLLFRFSDAIIAEWQVGAGDQPRAATVLQELKGQNTGPRCRVFIAAQSLSLRTSLLGRFDDPRFEVSTALQKQSIVDEPRFFTPDIVLIEDKLVAGDGEERFTQMLENLTPEATVIVVGHVPSLAEVIKRYPRRHIAQLQKLPKNLALSVLARYGRVDVSGLEADVAHVMPEHPYSLTEINVPARLHRVHPLAAQFATAYPISNFALCRLESPLITRFLGRSPYLKVTSTYHDTHPNAGQFVHLADCYFADVDQDERGLMAQGLTKLLSETLARLDPLALVNNKAPRGETRTPELGSVNREGLKGSVQPVSLPPPPSRPPSAAVASAPMFDGNAALQPNEKLSVQPITADEQRLVPTREIAELIRPALLDVASDIGREVSGIHRGVVKGVKKRVKKDHVVQSVTAALVIGALLLVMWIGFRLLSPDWHASGTVYSDQLKKFAPHLNKPTRP